MGSNIFELIDYAFEMNGINECNKTALEFIPDNRTIDKIMLSKVPLINSMVVQIFICASEIGLHFITYYPRTKSSEKINTWNWDDMYFASWRVGTFFYLKIMNKSDVVSLVCYRKDNNRLKNFTDILEKHFNENGENKFKFYDIYKTYENNPNEYVPQNVILKWNRFKKKILYNKLKSKIGIYLLIAMIIYIVVKGFVL